MTLLNDISRTVGERVYKTRHGYLITLSKPLRQNPIIVQTKNAFMIRDKNLADLPIGFQFVDNAGWVKQYWTLNGALHCMTGPALVMIFSMRQPSIWMEWFKHDMPHRNGGAATEKLKNVSFTKIDEDTVEEHSDSVDFRWFKDGTKWGKPEVMKANEFTRTRVNGEIVRIEAPLIQFSWTYHTVDHDTNRKFIIPESITIEDFSETRVDGEIKRTGRITKSSWLYQGGRRDVDGEETGFPQDFYLNEFGLWDWPMYKDSSIEYLMFEEFQKLPPP